MSTSGANRGQSARHGNQRRRLVVAGRVQGVGYRASCAAQARQLGLGGHVCNLSDGTVEVVVEGHPAAIEQLTSWCRLGPPHARVSEIDLTDEPARGEEAFTVR